MSTSRLITQLTTSIAPSTASPIVSEVSRLNQTTFAAARDGASGTNVGGALGPPDPPGSVGVNRVSSSSFYLYRVFFAFDTSVILSTDTIVSAIFRVDWDDFVGGDDHTIHLVDWTTESTPPFSVALADFSKFGTASLGSFLANSAETYDIPLGQSGLDLITKGGWTFFALVGDKDYDNSAPTSNGEYGLIYPRGINGNACRLIITHDRT